MTSSRQLRATEPQSACLQQHGAQDRWRLFWFEGGLERCADFVGWQIGEREISPPVESSPTEISAWLVAERVGRVLVGGYRIAVLPAVDGKHLGAKLPVLPDGAQLDRR